MLLELFGWHQPSAAVIKKLKTKRLVIVISHTTYWEFFMLLFYRILSDINPNLIIVMKPQPFENWGWFLKSMGCIPATKSEDTNGGFIQRTIKEYADKEEVQIVVSPEGKTDGTNWRSGYYYLCKGLKASVVAGGADYESKTLYMGPVHSYESIKDKSLEDVTAMLKADMGEIVPLNPSLSGHRITRKYDQDKISLMDWNGIIIVLLALIIIIVIIVILIKYFIASYSIPSLLTWSK